MATHEPSDDMAQEVERQLQLTLAAGALAAGKAIAHRRASLAEARAASEGRAEALRADLERQRTLASTQIQPVFDDAWWGGGHPGAGRSDVAGGRPMAPTHFGRVAQPLTSSRV